MMRRPVGSAHEKSVESVMGAIGEPSIRDTSAQDVVIDPAPARRRRRTLLIIGIAAGLAFLTVFAFLVRSWASSSVAVPRERVRIAEVVRGPFVSDVAAQGTVVVANNPTLFAAAMGTVTFHVRAGDSVTEGQVLATVDSPSLKSEYAREKATLDALVVELERARIETRRQILQNRQNADLATTRVRATERELERAKAAFEQGVIPRRDLDRAQDERDDARLVYDHALANAKLHEESLNFELKTKRVEVERQQLVVDELKRRVDALTVRSPVKGMVGSLLVDQRAAVTENAPLLTVVDLTALEVEFRVAETYAADLALNMAAEINYGGKTYPAVVTSISPEVQQNEVRGRLRFAEKLPPGVRQNQRVNVRLVLDSRENVLKVERGAFVDAGSIAYRVEGDVATRVPIVLGAMSVSEVEIVSGLKPGDRIIVSSVTDFGNAPELVLSD
ncbi:MAG: HlyD family efflux transporter periplasmic adaptor subunit [Steroidobacteraceae bacterium]|nr:HlyD family efflux transporter periplasmic adaptor subunit [Steroidobacteraceae bacterium]